MKHVTTRSPHRGRRITLALALAAAFASSYALPQAQTAKKKALTVDDYTKWRAISGQEISGDGKWVTYGLSLTNTAPTEPSQCCIWFASTAARTSKCPTRPAATFSADSNGSPIRSIRAAAAVDVAAAAMAAAGDTPPADTARRPRIPGAPAPALHRRRRRTDASRNTRPRHRRRRPGDGTGHDRPSTSARAAPGARGGSTTPPDQPDSRRAAQPRDGRRAVVAGHPVVHVLGHVEPAHSSRRRADGGRRRRRTRRGGGCRPDAGAGRHGQARPPRRQVRAAPTSSCTISPPDAISCSAASATSRSTRRATCSPTPSTPTPRDGNGLFVLDLAERPRESARQRRAHLQPAHVERRRHRRSRCSRASTSTRCASATTCSSCIPTCTAALGDAGAGAGRSSIRRRPAGFPKGWVVSDRAALDWSDDGKRVFFGDQGTGRRARHRAPRAAPTKSPTSTSGTRRTSASSRCR